VFCEPSSRYREEAYGGDVKKRWAILLFCVVIALVAFAAAENYFYSETTVISWHLSHGSYAELAGYKFKVPPFYYARDTHGLSRLSIEKIPGRVRHGTALISIEFQKQLPPEELQSSRFEQTMAKAQLRKIGERGITLAGKQGICVEFRTDTPNTGHDLTRQLMADIVTIRCSFGENLGSNFLGNSGLKGDFYEIMSTAELQGGQR
jgi:hypothetical protein